LLKLKGSASGGGGAGGANGGNDEEEGDDVISDLPSQRAIASANARNHRIWVIK
jgi:hypothetical protein